MEIDPTPFGFQLTSVYLLIGLVFGIFFIILGARWLDQDVKGSNWKFRLMILPGSILLWPYLIYRLIKIRLL